MTSLATFTMSIDRRKDESRPFLDHHVPASPVCPSQSCGQYEKAARRWRWIACTAIASNLLILAVAALVLSLPGRLQYPASYAVGASLYSPLEASTKYVEETCDQAQAQRDRYTRLPTPESEQAWSELAHHPRPVYFAPPDAQRLGFREQPDSAGAQNGSFAVSVGVFHNLHCLWNVRMSFFEDYFFANQTREEKDARREHNLHCLEAIRSSVVCNADLTAYPLLWKDGKQNSELVLNAAINRRCVDLNALKEEMERYHVTN